MNATPCVFSAWTFSTLSPPLLAGELFQCSVQIAASAPPGNYPVNLRDGGAGGRGAAYGPQGLRVLCTRSSHLEGEVALLPRC